MYLPEDNEQMFEILAELRVYAAMNAFTNLAEELDDALVLLRTEIRRQEDLAGSGCHPSMDKR
ncbi:hypothetical protein [Amaricoccus macauensis]|uniref:hypothetical protein n=1 Tax=Amaricoccus macauensis TaxID=57001 RepID=UPI003C7BCCDA